MILCPRVTPHLFPYSRSTGNSSNFRIALKDWRHFQDVRIAPHTVPQSKRTDFRGRLVTGWLRTGEFWVFANRTAANDNDIIAAPGDAKAQSPVVMRIGQKDTLGDGLLATELLSRGKATTSEKPPENSRKLPRPVARISTSLVPARRPRPAIVSIPRVAPPTSSTWVFAPATMESTPTFHNQTADQSEYEIGQLHDLIAKDKSYPTLY